MAVLKSDRARIIRRHTRLRFRSTRFEVLEPRLALSGSTATSLGVVPDAALMTSGWEQGTFGATPYNPVTLTSFALADGTLYSAGPSYDATRSTVADIGSDLTGLSGYLADLVEAGIAGSATDSRLADSSSSMDDLIMRRRPSVEIPVNVSLSASHTSIASGQALTL